MCIKIIDVFLHTQITTDLITEKAGTYSSAVEKAFRAAVM